MRFAVANMRELIAEDQHTAAQLFQPFRNGGDRGSHIHLFLTNFVPILFLPTIGLCHLKLGGGEAAFLAVFHTEVFFLGLVCLFRMMKSRQLTISICLFH